MPDFKVIWAKIGADLKVVKTDGNPATFTQTVSEYKHYADIAAADAAIVAIHVNEPSLILKSGNPSAPPPQPW